MLPCGRGGPRLCYAHTQRKYTHSAHTKNIEALQQNKQLHEIGGGRDIFCFKGVGSTSVLCMRTYVAFIKLKLRHKQQRKQR